MRARPRRVESCGRSGVIDVCAGATFFDGGLLVFMVNGSMFSLCEVGLIYGTRGLFLGSGQAMCGMHGTVTGASLEGDDFSG
jgi:hypothetical protein